LTIIPPLSLHLLFSYTHPPPTAISPLSLHDALPIFGLLRMERVDEIKAAQRFVTEDHKTGIGSRQVLQRLSAQEQRSGHHSAVRSEEHTSELQSLTNLVCRLLLEKKKTTAHARHTVD